MICRIRIMDKDGQVQVLDQTWSQLCDTIRELTCEEKGWFWKKQSVVTPDGGSIKLVKEGV